MMFMFKNEIVDYFLNLPRPVKKIVVILCDFGLTLICAVAAFYLRLDQLMPLRGPVLISGLISACLLIPIFWLMGMYRIIFRFSGLNIIFSVFISILLYGFFYFIVIGLYGIVGIPRSIGILQPILLFFGVIGSRLLIKLSFVKGRTKKFKSLRLTLIYGAGSAGRQLLNSLENSFELKVVGFLDDDERLHGQILQGYKIYNPDDLEKLIKSKGIELVLLALPSVRRSQRKEILEKLYKYKIAVQTLPSLTDIVQGKISISDIKDLDVNDILERDIVPPNKDLLSKNIFSKVILITGAGGSIGSELCRQVINSEPKTLILCELSEFALYKIYEEIKIVNKKIKVVPLICNVQDENKMNEILKTFKVDTIYHAAAYKHVPLVETNISEGVMNNIFGTYVLAKSSINNGVSSFVLISSDKAVRPSNIMGASKRLAELCVQALFHEYKIHKTNICIVRFGNVIESSGSVIPKFKQQIKEGGPITLTHPDVTRYFMTSIEAAQLVIQAGAMSQNCDVFILDMGKSVKIKDLIYRIVKLSGFEIKDEKNPDGDIEIKVIGLRPGEKLYEELLLGDNPQPTIHRKIKKAEDPFITLSELEKTLSILKTHIFNNEADKIKSVLENIITSYKSEYKIADYLHIEKAGLIDDKNYKEYASKKVIKINKQT